MSYALHFGIVNSWEEVYCRSSSSNLQDEIHLMVWNKMCFHLLWYALYPGIVLAPSFQLKPSNKSIHVFLSEAQNYVQKCFEEEDHSSCLLMKCFSWQLTEFWLHAEWLPSVQVKHCVHIEQKTQVMSHTSWTCDCQGSLLTCCN